MTHDEAFELLPDLLLERDDPALLAHVRGCHACQRQLFLLGRVDRLLRDLRRPRRRSSWLGGRGRRLSLLAGLVAGLVAALVLTLVLPRDERPAQRFVLRTADGFPLARGRLERADDANVTVSLVARGLPTGPHRTYVLWTQPADARRALLVGRFMTDRSGVCRARFNLPRDHRWTRFWVTLESRPSQIVATT